MVTDGSRFRLPRLSLWSSFQPPGFSTDSLTGMQRSFRGFELRFRRPAVGVTGADSEERPVLGDYAVTTPMQFLRQERSSR